MRSKCLSDQSGALYSTDRVSGDWVSSTHVLKSCGSGIVQGSTLRTTGAVTGEPPAVVTVTAPLYVPGCEVLGTFTRTQSGTTAPLTRLRSLNLTDTGNSPRGSVTRALRAAVPSG